MARITANVLLLLFLSFVTSVVAEDNLYEIFARSIQSSKLIPIGSVHYNKADKTALFTGKEDVVGAGDYCIGTNDLKGHDCFTYTVVNSDEPILFGKSIKLQLNRDDEVDQIALVNRIGEQDNIIVSSAVQQPIPNLNPVHATKQASQGPPKSTKTVTVKETVVDEDGNEVQIETERVVEEELDTRPFIQKYWMYIIPAVLLLVGMQQPEESSLA